MSFLEAAANPANVIEGLFHLRPWYYSVSECSASLLHLFYCRSHPRKQFLGGRGRITVTCWIRYSVLLTVWRSKVVKQSRLSLKRTTNLKSFLLKVPSTSILRDDLLRKWQRLEESSPSLYLPAMEVVISVCTDWGEEEEDQTDKQLWEDNWDDDNVEDDFSVQLRWGVI